MPHRLQSFLRACSIVVILLLAGCGSAQRASDEAVVAANPDARGPGVDDSDSTEECGDLNLQVCVREGWASYDANAYDRARELFERACEGGEAAGCGSLGVLYIEGVGVERNLSQGVGFLRRACEGGHGPSCGEVGRLYRHGQAVERDVQQAALLFERACDAGDRRGCNDAGELFFNGEVVGRDVARAAEFFRRSCELEDSRGCGNYGVFLLSRDDEGDLARAVEMLQSACHQDESQACYNLGVLHRDGRGVPQDAARARELYLVACEHDNMNGCLNLGVALYQGTGGPRRVEQARGLFELACDEGLQSACSNLRELDRVAAGRPADDETLSINVLRPPDPSLDRTEAVGPSWSVTIGSLTLGEGAARATFTDVNADCGMLQVVAALDQIRRRATSCLRSDPSPRISIQFLGGRPDSMSVEPNNAQGQCFLRAIRAGSYAGATCSMEFTVQH